MRLKLAVWCLQCPIQHENTILQGLAEAGIEVEPERAQLDTLGLNHLTWHRGFTVDGEDMWPRAGNVYRSFTNRKKPEWPPP